VLVVAGESKSPMRVSGKQAARPAAIASLSRSWSTRAFYARARERRKLDSETMTMENVEWLAFVGHLRGGQMSGGLLKLFCSPACVTAAGHERYQPITRSAALQSVLINMSDFCAQCGKEFTAPAQPR
jgi:hypothetical protein